MYLCLVWQPWCLLVVWQLLLCTYNSMEYWRTSEIHNNLSMLQNKPQSGTLEIVCRIAACAHCMCITVPYLSVHALVRTLCTHAKCLHMCLCNSCSMCLYLLLVVSVISIGHKQQYCVTFFVCIITVTCCSKQPKWCWCFTTAWRRAIFLLKSLCTVILNWPCLVWELYLWWSNPSCAILVPSLCFNNWL